MHAETCKHDDKTMDYAIDVAVFTYNRTWYTRIGDTPIALFNPDEKIDISKLRVFGCIGVAHIDKDRRKKSNC